jgi:putative hydrolase of the HAD superfamily
VTAGRVRAVFFDVGGTLIEPAPSVGEIYAQVARRHGIAAEPARLEAAFRQSWAALAGGAVTVSRKQWWREVVFRTLGCENEACFEELYEFFARPEAWRVYPDVEPTLRAAKARGLHVGIISNWDERLRPLLNAIGLARQLDSMTISCEVAAEKPSPKIFHAALRTAGVAPHEALHVGDAYEEDVRGAHAAGLKALLLDRAVPATSLLSLVSAAVCG